MGAQLRLGASFSVLITNVCYYIFTDNKQRKSYYNVKIIFEEITGHEKESDYIAAKSCTGIKQY